MNTQQQAMKSALIEVNKHFRASKSEQNIIKILLDGSLSDNMPTFGDDFLSAANSIARSALEYAPQDPSIKSALLEFFLEQVKEDDFLDQVKKNAPDFVRMIRPS